MNTRTYRANPPARSWGGPEAEARALTASVLNSGYGSLVAAVQDASEWERQALRTLVQRARQVKEEGGTR